MPEVWRCESLNGKRTRHLARPAVGTSRTPCAQAGERTRTTPSAALAAAQSLVQVEVERRTSLSRLSGGLCLMSRIGGQSGE